MARGQHGTESRLVKCSLAAAKRIYDRAMQQNAWFAITLHESRSPPESPPKSPPKSPPGRPAGCEPGIVIAGIVAEPGAGVPVVKYGVRGMDGNPVRGASACRIHAAAAKTLRVRLT